MKSFFVITIFAGFLLVGCSDQTVVTGDSERDLSELNTDLENQEEKEKMEAKGSAIESKDRENVRYTMSLISGLEFYKKRNQLISTKDSLDLVKETVVLMEIESLDEKKGIWSLPSLQYTKEEGASYLVGGIGEDLSIQKGKKAIHAYGVNYEHQYGSEDKIKVFFFFGDTPKEEIKELVYYDRLFASGMMRFKMN